MLMLLSQVIVEVTPGNYNDDSTPKCHPNKELANSYCASDCRREHDLPESLVTFLINFVLDGVGLYAEELLMSATECARQSNRFWLGPGNDDEARTKTFDKLLEARMKLNELARVAIGR
ncbi:unnamed protein product [Cylicocyclus nassatus]|uniref:Uncharacterized protein n=1 Tax=Cylicocyclus nassatus TaxID=53992 RepID=A0AA36HB92_CYLNA|nr:unnamed protein product [Cylicocyclus nassatus]